MSSLEAMGRGLPCILSDLPVHREITDDGEGAMLFASGDEGSLQKAITLLATDAAVRAKFASQGYRIIGERYTAERVRVAYLKVFAGNL